MQHPNAAEIDAIIENALREDIGEGDITTQLLIPEELNAYVAFVARESLVCCGLVEVVEKVFRQLSEEVHFTVMRADGEVAQEGETIAEVTGPARALLTGERVALNLLQRMCGVATLTTEYVQAVAGTKATILDTRKTMPGLRELDKYATRIGGGQNHRMRLDDMVLIKDNHIALAGGIQAALKKAFDHVPTGIKVVVECDTLEQVKEAIECGADRILLDNMSLDDLREAVILANNRVKLEASGGVSLETVRDIAETGVDYISIGKLTHSATAVDIGLDIKFLTTEPE